MKKTALPKAQIGKIVKTVSTAAKVAGKGAKKASGSVLDLKKAATKSDVAKGQTKNVSKELSVYQKERMAQGKPVYRGSNPKGNMTMREIQAKKDLQKAVQKKPKKLTKEQQYQKDIEDSYRQTGGATTGRSISQRAADRKVRKGKGIITKSYPAGPEEKGSYVGFSKEARKSDSPFKSMKDSKPARPIKKKGGAIKKGY
jgi:hypothetical protein